MFSFRFKESSAVHAGFQSAPWSCVLHLPNYQSTKEIKQNEKEPVNRYSFRFLQPERKGKKAVVGPDLFVCFIVQH